MKREWNSVEIWVKLSDGPDDRTFMDNLYDMLFEFVHDACGEYDIAPHMWVTRRENPPEGVEED